MPSLYIMSLLDRQKQKWWGRITKARQELAQFEESLDGRLPKSIADIVRQHAHPPWPSLLQGSPSPEMPVEGQEALAQVQKLIRNETSLTRRLHSPVCCYTERPKLPYVFWCYGVTWDDVMFMRDEDGNLPLRNVLWLLDVILGDPRQVMPTKRQVKTNGITTEALEGWESTFRRNRRRLMRFLRMAAQLEEDLVWGII